MKIKSLIAELIQHDMDNVDPDIQILVDNKAYEYTFTFEKGLGDVPVASFSVTTSITDTTPVVVENAEPVTSSPEEVINPRAAHVGSNTSQGKGNWFAGTSWG